MNTMSDELKISDATSVEIDRRRWYATFRIERSDGTTTEFFVCADGEHSGLWLGDRADHVEHS